MSIYERIMQKVKEENLDGLFLAKDANVRYISGFTGADSYVLISPDKKIFITDARYTEQAENECKDFEIIEWREKKGTLEETIAHMVTELGIKRLGFEKNVITYDLYDRIVNKLSGAQLVPTKGMVEDLRYTKNDFEIECMSKAAEFADKAFDKILGIIKPGLTETELALELEYYLRKSGSEGPGFPTILISGKKTSMPHGIPSDKKVENGDFITMDFGGLYNGYRSDMTRTIVVGKADQEQRKIYNIIKEAQQRGVDALKDGVAGNIPDKAVREVIEEAGYIDKYYPGLGHGVGLEIHEEPFMGAKCKTILRKGCVVTVEPGVYIPGWGGVRIEDTVAIREEGIEILTKSPKDLIII